MWFRCGFIITLFLCGFIHHVNREREASEGTEGGNFSLVGAQKYVYPHSMAGGMMRYLFLTLEYDRLRNL